MASALVAVALWLLHLSPGWLAALLVVVVVVGTWAADEAEPRLGGRDPGVIVVDEVAGMLLAVLAAPPTAAVIAVGFVLFRVFDVLKPFPANVSQRLRGGLGIMVDDLIAGLYALLLVLLARRLGWL